MKFILNDFNFEKDFFIEYMTENFISVKKELNKDNALELLPSFSIRDIETIIEMLKHFIEVEWFRKKDEENVKELLQISIDVRSGNI